MSDSVELIRILEGADDEEFSEFESIHEEDLEVSLSRSSIN
jgi:hypothetical protein